MPGTRGFDGLLELRTAWPKQPIVIVSAHEDPRIIHEAMTCGAAGYISKSVKKPELAEAIQDVMSGLVTLPKGYEPPSDTGRLARGRSRHPRCLAHAPAAARAADGAPGHAQQADRA